MIRVLICDDQLVICDGLELILATDPELEVVGAVQDGAQAVDDVGRLQPDVVLMDLKIARHERNSSDPTDPQTIPTSKSIGSNHLWR